MKELHPITDALRGSAEGERIPGSWRQVLPPEASALGENLADRIAQARAGGQRILPDRVFRALEMTAPSAVRAVLLGQDPYPTPGHANGLCFSVNPDVMPLPRSLGNIFREYQSDLGYPAPSTGDLAPWAAHGVLLLNAVLTTPAGKANSHRSLGWQGFTSAVLTACLEQPGPVVFLLWGREARATFDRAAQTAGVQAVPMTDKTKDGTKDGAKSRTESGTKNGMEGGNVLRVGQHFAVLSSHPSPLGARRPCGDAPAFLGSRPFSTANRLLGDAAVDWRLP